LFRKQAVLERVLILLWRARTSRAAVHPAPLLAVHGGGSTTPAYAGLGAASRARQHRPGVAEMVAAHFFGFSGEGASSSCRFSRTAIGAIRASAMASGAVAIPSAALGAVCETLPAFASRSS